MVYIEDLNFDNLKPIFKAKKNIMYSKNNWNLNKLLKNYNVIFDVYSIEFPINVIVVRTFNNGDKSKINFLINDKVFVLKYKDSSFPIYKEIFYKCYTILE